MAINSVSVIGACHLVVISLKNNEIHKVYSIRETRLDYIVLF